METYYSLKNKIVQTSLAIIENNLSKPLEIDDSIKADQHFRKTGKLSHEEFVRSCHLFQSKNVYWTFNEEYNYLKYKDSIIKSSNLDAYFEDIIEENEYDLLEEPWTEYKIEGQETVVFDFADVSAKSGKHLQKIIRTYDVYIIYDKYYMVPRIYLIGRTITCAP